VEEMNEKEVEQSMELMTLQILTIYKTVMRKTSNETLAKEMVKTYLIAMVQSTKPDPLRFFLNGNN